MVISRNEQIWCDDERRSGELIAPGHPLNGVDFVEFVRDLGAPLQRQYRLEATFFKPPPVSLAAAPQAFEVLGGVRVVGIRVLAVEADPAEPLRLLVFVDQEGDFSSYVLRIEDPGLDSERAEARFSFKAGCPSDFDCQVTPHCPPAALDEPLLDYLARDYQSFRRLMLDLIPSRNPDWIERLPADSGIALVELFAYVGDYLSYYQDAAGTEAYLDSCLHRISAARHSGLIDYRMHQGRNAFCYVHFAAEPGTDGIVPAGAKLLTRVGNALRGEAAAPGVIVPLTADFDTDPALADVTVFEATAITRVTDLHNELRIHDWGDTDCCLAQGAREAYLFGVPPGSDPTAFRPRFEVGDYVLLEQVRSPATGAPADADPGRRQVVRLVEVNDSEDTVYRDMLSGGDLTPRTSAGDAALPLQRIAWGEEDALNASFCLSAETPDAGVIDPVSVARGNVAPVDHGRTVVRTGLAPPGSGSGRWPLPDLSLDDGPLTWQPMPDSPRYASGNRLMGGRHELGRDVRQVMPAIVLTLHFPGGEEERWLPVPNLLDSGPFDQQFVAEVDNAGRAVLRFGDDQYGRRPLGAEGVTASIRIGNGRPGNIGAGALVHIVQPSAAELTDPANPAAGPADFAAVERVYQPLSARLGTEPETIEEVRQLAPEAFRAIQYRAVTEADWQEVAQRHPGVAASRVRFRWTGSWHTVFVAIHPLDTTDLVRLAGGGAALAPGFAAGMRQFLRRFKLAGYDLCVRAARYVPLEVGIRVCVASGHFRGDVLEAVAEALSNRVPGGGARGIFHPLEFNFGESVYLSRLYAAVEAVEGVESSIVTVFKRYWEVEKDELQRGLIEIGEMEIARLDNDANFPENGVLKLTAVGGL